MRRMLLTIIVLVVCAWTTVSAPANPSERSIDTASSSLRVHVYKSGLFSPFAHDHEIEAPIQSGSITETGTPSVELRVDARQLHVLDPEVSSDTRVEIQNTMLGPRVLDADRYTEIHFVSIAVQPAGTDHWIVTGNLSLHGQTHQVTVDVARKDGLYKGSATLKQTSFGITPVTVAAGTVKVKDELKIDFQIATTPE